MEDTCKSEVAYLLAEIKLQHEAAERGLSGLAQGTARHKFISARMERIGQIHEELQHLVGPDRATQLVTETLQAHTGGGKRRKAFLIPDEEKQ